MATFSSLKLNLAPSKTAQTSASRSSASAVQGASTYQAPRPTTQVGPPGPPAGYYNTPSAPSGGGGGGAPAPSGGGGGGGGGGYDQLQAQQDQINQQLENDYNQAMGALGQQEQGLQSQAGSANAQISNDIAAGKTSLGAAQSTGEAAQQANISTATTQGATATQQARDLFRQTQQSNNAQLSALGISSSSVSEALAERLGVETARRIAGITGSVQEITQNATQEIGRIKTYYGERMTQLEESGRIQKEQIQQALMQGLNQINSARQQASSDKAARRAELLGQVNNAISSLAQQQQQFTQSLQQWATQKTSSLQQIVTDPNLVASYNAGINTINSQFNPTQTVVGNYALDANNNPGYIMNKPLNTVAKAKKPEEDDLLSKYGVN